MSTDNPAAEAPQTVEVEIWVEWHDAQGLQQRDLYVNLERPAATLHPTHEESILLETKLCQIVPIPEQNWVSLAVQYPSEDAATQVYSRYDRFADSMQSLRECQAGMWNRLHRFPTARFDGSEIAMILVVVIDPEAVTDWLLIIPVTRHVNLKLYKIIRDEQIKKLLDILDPVHDVLQLPDPGNLLEDEDDSDHQTAEQNYRYAVARITGVEAEANSNFGPRLVLWRNIHMHLLRFMRENDEFLAQQPGPDVESKRASYPWSARLGDRFRELTLCVDQLMGFFQQYPVLTRDHHEDLPRVVEVQYRDHRRFVAQEYVQLLLHTFDVPIAQPETTPDHVHSLTGNSMITTFWPDTVIWDIQPQYRDNDRRLHYQQHEAYTTFLQDCALFMLIQADPGTARLWWYWVDDRFADFINSYDNLLNDRTQEEELTTEKMTDLALHYAKKRPPGGSELGKRKFQDLNLLLDQLKACLSVY
jgi:hypothetical protein